MDIPITVTKRALKEIRNIRDHKHIPPLYGLRVGIKGAGCAGISYLLGFDRGNENDVTYDVQGIQVHIAKKHTLYLVGLVLDFYEGDDAKGFLFSRPEEDRSID